MVENVYVAVAGLKKVSAPKEADTSEPVVLCSQIDRLRDGRFPIGNSDRYGTLLPHETRDVGRNAVVAVAQDVTRGLTRQLDRVDG